MASIQENIMNISLMTLVCVLVYILLKFLYWLYKTVAEVNIANSSDAVKQLTELNEVYKDKLDFSLPMQVEYDISLNSKAKFERFKPDLALLNILKTPEQEDYHLQLIERYRENKHYYAEYLQKFREISSSPYLRKARRISLHKKIEEDIIRRCQLKVATKMAVALETSYISPRRRNHYHKEYIYDETEILKLRSRMKNEEHKKLSEEYRRRNARNAMTTKLRIQILERDGFRCRLCGRSAEDGVKLEVDHIIPVAKNGRTEPDNLQTLCQDCNRGKGTQILRKS